MNAKSVHNTLILVYIFQTSTSDSLFVFLKIADCFLTLARSQSSPNLNVVDPLFTSILDSSPRYDCVRNR